MQSPSLAKKGSKGHSSIIGAADRIYILLVKEPQIELYHEGIGL